jgi:hypothetical protein
VGVPPESPPALPPVHHGAVVPEPEQAVRARLARGVRQVLIRWKGEPPSASTWEDVDSFIDKYPDVQLEDELLIEGGEMSCGVGTTSGGAEPRPPANSHRRHLVARFQDLLDRFYSFVSRFS